MNVHPDDRLPWDAEHQLEAVKEQLRRIFPPESVDDPASLPSEFVRELVLGHMLVYDGKITPMGQERVFDGQGGA